jgi:hypothetical protein
MAAYIGTSSLSALYLGSTRISKLYVGTTLLFDETYITTQNSNELTTQSAALFLTQSSTKLSM